MNEVVSLFIHLLICCDYLRKNRTNKDTRGNNSNELVQDREGSWVDSKMRQLECVEMRLMEQD